MRLDCVLLIVSVLLVCCGAINIDHPKLPRSVTSDPIHASNSVRDNPVRIRLLRTSNIAAEEETDSDEDEERGLFNAAKQLALRTKFITNRGIRTNLKTFKEWYANGKTPEMLWQDSKLAPVMKRDFNNFKGMCRLKANPDFQLHLNYELFYKIMKGTYGKAS
ncbi:hypothetical protein PHYBOEH_000956 [Phytophthora boehmeriae]|uniref:RxLR effector protein n=1 Tax=Phytophthora boehmeriae TaxID=109152 RepID=A0A8T1V8D0_9STRA|nr:hypothetical protein PHYBOEH_000956 [Phytophthora boehmeriae]